MDEQGSIVLLEKGKELKAKSKDGSKFLTADEVINERLEFHQALVKSNAGTPPATPGAGKTIVEGADQKVHSVALNKAQQHAANMKAAAEASKG